MGAIVSEGIWHQYIHGSIVVHQHDTSHMATGSVLDERQVQHQAYAVLVWIQLAS